MTSISLHIKNFNGEKQTIMIKNDALFSELVKNVAQTKGLTPEKLRLVFLGQEINMERHGQSTLDKLDLENGSTLFYVLRTRGG